MPGIALTPPAAVRSLAAEPAGAPDLDWRRLRRQLQQARPSELMAASLRYCAPFGRLRELHEHWAWELHFERRRAELFGEQLFEARQGALRIRYLQRAPAEGGTPLLLLHGATLGPAELSRVLTPLVAGTSVERAFELVCPQLDGMPADAAARALACAQLMRALGYARYLVHGSGSGAAVALALAAEHGRELAGVHVSGLGGLAPSDPRELSTLTPPEKSQLALLSLLRRERARKPPRTALEALADALGQLEQEEGTTRAPAWRDALLTALTLTWCRGNARAERRGSLEPCALTSQVPLSVHCFPLDVPCLRRPAQTRFHVLEWHEHARGGPWPALEQPELLWRTLCSFRARVQELHESMEQPGRCRAHSGRFSA